MPRTQLYKIQCHQKPTHVRMHIRHIEAAHEKNMNFTKSKEQKANYTITSKRMQTEQKQLHKTTCNTKKQPACTNTNLTYACPRAIGGHTICTHAPRMHNCGARMLTPKHTHAHTQSRCASEKIPKGNATNTRSDAMRSCSSLLVPKTRGRIDYRYESLNTPPTASTSSASCRR